MHEKIKKGIRKEKLMKEERQKWDFKGLKKQKKFKTTTQLHQKEKKKRKKKRKS